MSDYVPIDPPTGASGARGLRTGVFLAIIALAFVAGAVLTGYLMRHVSWLGGTPTATKTTPEPVNYNPAQPLNAGCVDHHRPTSQSQQFRPQGFGILKVEDGRQNHLSRRGHQNSSQPSSEAAGSGRRAAPPRPTVRRAATGR